jgi:hypothetical protein
MAVGRNDSGYVFEHSQHIVELATGQIASFSVRQIRSFPQKAVGHEQRSIGIARVCTRAVDHAPQQPAAIDPNDGRQWLCRGPAGKLRLWTREPSDPSSTNSGCADSEMLAPPGFCT